jgi:hypothetical protein
MLYHPDPHFEGEFHTETGGEILIVSIPADHGRAADLCRPLQHDGAQGRRDERVDL